MGETRKQLKERLRAAGVWQDYLALREQLTQPGRTARQAREEALRQIDSRPPQQADLPTPDRPGDGVPVEELFKQPPLCSRCERFSGTARCPACRDNEWREYAAFCERQGLDPGCRRCHHFGQPACPDCYRKARTVENLIAAGFLAEAKRLADWIEPWSQAGGPEFRRAQLEIQAEMPPTPLIDMRLVYLGKV